MINDDKNIQIKKKNSFSNILVCLIFFVGVLLIVLGSTYPILMKATEKKKSIASTLSENKKDVISKMECSYLNANDIEGAKIVFSEEYTFKNDKLQDYVKIYTLTPLNDSSTAQAAVNGSLIFYEKFKTDGEYPGYSVSTKKSNNGMQVITKIDFHKINKDKIPQKYNENALTSVDYQKDIIKSELKESLIVAGYDCIEK